VGTDGKTREDTGGIVDSTEIENETIGTGLATTEKWEFTIGAKRKKGERDCGEASEILGVKKGIVD
jgi:hypothetical protein